MGDFLKCRWCGFRVMKYRTSKDGKVVTGWKTLALHVDDRHEAEAERLRLETGADLSALNE